MQKEEENSLEQLTGTANFILPLLLFRIHAHPSPLTHTHIHLLLWPPLQLHSDAFKWKSILLMARI